MITWATAAIAFCSLAIFGPASASDAAQTACRANPSAAAKKARLDTLLSKSEFQLEEINKKLTNLGAKYAEKVVIVNAPPCHGNYEAPEFESKKVVMCAVTNEKGELLDSIDFSLCTHSVIRLVSTGWSYSQFQYQTVADMQHKIRIKHNTSVILEIAVYAPSWVKFVFNTIMETGVDGALFSLKKYEPVEKHRQDHPIDSWKIFMGQISNLLKPKGKQIFAEMPLEHNSRGRLTLDYASLDGIVDKWILPSYWIKKDTERAIISETIETLEQNLLFISRWLDPEKIVLQRSTEFDSRLLQISRKLRSNRIYSPTLNASDPFFNPEYLSSRVLTSLGEVCKLRVTANKKLKLVYNETETLNLYANFEREWISFDPPSILREKIKVIKNQKLAGVYLNFTLGDDFDSLCKCGPQPLLRTISEELLAGGRCKVDGCLV